MTFKIHGREFLHSYCIKLHSGNDLSQRNSKITKQKQKQAITTAITPTTIHLQQQQQVVSLYVLLVLPSWSAELQQNHCLIPLRQREMKRK